LRYGGYETFDIPWVQEAVRLLLKKIPKVYFVFMNTKPFVLHKRVLYLPARNDKQYKVNALFSSNLFLHARLQGECFSMTLLEAMFSSIPILSWSGGVDQGHKTVLDRRSFYKSSSELLNKFEAIISQGETRWDYIATKQYSEEKVMELFTEVFLEGSI
jgi:hypothetical protein